MKNTKIKFFFWFYYPKTNHIIENSRSFIEDLYSGYPKDSIFQTREKEDFVTNFFKYGLINYYSTYAPGEKTSRRLKEGILAILSPVAGDPEGYLPKAPHFVRDDCITMTMMIQDKLEWESWEWREREYLKVFEIFSEHFMPIYGFGHRQWNRWWDRSFMEPPPETRIWPYNIFDLPSYDSSLIGHLEYFVRDNPDWILKVVNGRTAILRLRDLRRKESEIKPESSHAILGEGEKQLLPRGAKLSSSSKGTVD